MQTSKAINPQNNMEERYNQGITIYRRFNTLAKPDVLNQAQRIFLQLKIEGLSDATYWLIKIFAERYQNASDENARARFLSIIRTHINTLSSSISTCRLLTTREKKDFRRLISIYNKESNACTPESELASNLATLSNVLKSKNTRLTTSSFDFAALKKGSVAISNTEVKESFNKVMTKIKKSEDFNFTSRISQLLCSALSGERQALNDLIEIYKNNKNPLYPKIIKCLTYLQSCINNAQFYNPDSIEVQKKLIKLLSITNPAYEKLEFRLSFELASTLMTQPYNTTEKKHLFALKQSKSLFETLKADKKIQDNDELANIEDHIQELSECIKTTESHEQQQKREEEKQLTQQRKKEYRQTPKITPTRKKKKLKKTATKQQEISELNDKQFQDFSKNNCYPLIQEQSVEADIPQKGNPKRPPQKQGTTLIELFEKAYKGSGTSNTKKTRTRKNKKNTAQTTHESQNKSSAGDQFTSIPVQTTATDLNRPETISMTNIYQNAVELDGNQINFINTVPLDPLIEKVMASINLGLGFHCFLVGSQATKRVRCLLQGKDPSLLPRQLQGKDIDLVAPFPIPPADHISFGEYFFSKNPNEPRLFTNHEYNIDLFFCDDLPQIPTYADFNPRALSTYLTPNSVKRDFTCNTSFISVHGFAFCSERGQEAIQNNLVETILPPKLCFIIDTVRTIRYIKLLNEGWSGAHDPMALQSCLPLIKITNQSRLFSSLGKLFKTGSAQNNLCTLQYFGLLDTIFPGITEGCGFAWLKKRLYETDNLYQTNPYLSTPIIFSNFVIARLLSDIQAGNYKVSDVDLNLIQRVMRELHFPETLFKILSQEMSSADTITNKPFYKSNLNYIGHICKTVEAEVNSSQSQQAIQNGYLSEYGLFNRSGQQQSSVTTDNEKMLQP